MIAKVPIFKEPEVPNCADPMDILSDYKVPNCADPMDILSDYTFHLALLNEFPSTSTTRELRKTMHCLRVI